MRYIVLLVLGMSGPLFFTGCSSGSDAPASSQASLAVTTANSKLKAMSDMIDGVSSSSLSSVNIPMRNDLGIRASGINAVWTTSPGVAPLSNSGNSSLKQWMIDEFDENFVNSNGAKVTFAGRIANALNIFCFMGLAGLPNDTANLPAVGTYTITLSAFMVSVCEPTSTDMIGQTVTLTATNPTDTTTYDRLLSFTFAGQESCPFRVQARVNASVINLAESEDQSCDGRDHASLGVFTHDKTTLVTKFYYVSKAFSGYPSGYEVYRGYLNEVTDEAYVIGFYGGDDNGDTTFPNGVSYTTVGKPQAGGTVAISVKSIGNTIGDGEYQGCIDGDMNVASDNTLSCTLTGFDSTTTHSTVVQDLYDDYASRASIFNMSETVAVGFTDNTDIAN